MSSTEGTIQTAPSEDVKDAPAGAAAVQPDALQLATAIALALRDSAAAAQASSVSVDAVAVKLAPFWSGDPEFWFGQAESQFAVRTPPITADSTKYHHVVSSLDQQTASRCRDIIANPPAVEKYAAIKARLLQCFGLSRADRARRMLRMSGLGDRKPTQLMDDMLALHGDLPICYLFQSIFLEQLPEDVRLQLASEDFSDPRGVALKADHLLNMKSTGISTVLQKRLN